jgi:hypothetical protein
MDIYKDLNQWIYLHLDTAHEASGQHAGLLDLDLPEHLELILDDRTIVFLEADHGMRYGEWYQSESGYFEHKLPAFFIIAPTGILDKIEGSYGNLYHNTMRITSK